MYTICEPVCCVDFGSVCNNNYIAIYLYNVLPLIIHIVCMVLPIYRLPTSIQFNLLAHIIIIYYTISRVRVLYGFMNI